MLRLPANVLFDLGGYLSGIEIIRLAQTCKTLRKQVQKLTPQWLNQRTKYWLTMLQTWTKFEAVEDDYDWEGPPEKILTNNRERANLGILPLEWRAFQLAYQQYPSLYINLITQKEIAERVQACKKMKAELTIPVAWINAPCCGAGIPCSCPWKDAIHQFVVLYYSPKNSEYYVQNVSCSSCNYQTQEQILNQRFPTWVKNFPLIREKLKLPAKRDKCYHWIFQMDLFLKHGGRMLSHPRMPSHIIPSNYFLPNLEQGMIRLLQKAGLYDKYHLSSDMGLYNFYKVFGIGYPGKTVESYCRRVRKAYDQQTIHWKRYHNRTKLLYGWKTPKYHRK